MQCRPEDSTRSLLSQFASQCSHIVAIMKPTQAPRITDTPATPIEPPEILTAARSRSRSRSRSPKWLDTFVTEARSHSSSASSRRSRSSEGVKDVIANLGLAAGTIGTEHVKPRTPLEEDILEGVRAFLGGFHNIIRHAKTGRTKSPERIEVAEDAQSEHHLHPITEATKNPFGNPPPLDTESAAEWDPEPEPEPQSSSPSQEDSRDSEPEVNSISREESFGEFVYDILMYEKDSNQKIPGRARLDTGMTCNAVSLPQALMLGYPIEEYKGDPCIVADGSTYNPVGQVKLPFHFVNARNEHIWRIDFIVFPDGCPFDLCLGRRFISLAKLLKRNPQVAPVEFRRLKPSEEREKKNRTYQASRESEYTRYHQDGRYVDRRNTRLIVKDSRKPYY